MKLTDQRKALTLKVKIVSGCVQIFMVLTLNNKPLVVPDAVRREAGLRCGDRVEFKVSGRAITIVPKESAEGDYSMKTVMRVIKEAKAQPMTPRQGAALDASLMAYGAKQAKKLDIKERDIPRIIHASRARRRTP